MIGMLALVTYTIALCPKLLAIIIFQLVHPINHHVLLVFLANLIFVAVEHTSNAPFQIIHSNVWGLFPILSFHGYRYFVVFIDDFTRCSWIYFLKNKSDDYFIFLNFESYVHRQFNSKILAFHLDRRGEFQKLHSYFNKNRIIHRISCPYMHEKMAFRKGKLDI